eukprot:Gb_12316 [translate_table: standard]
MTSWLHYLLLCLMGPWGIREWVQEQQLILFFAFFGRTLKFKGGRLTPRSYLLVGNTSISWSWRELIQTSLLFILEMQWSKTFLVGFLALWWICSWEVLKFLSYRGLAPGNV